MKLITLGYTNKEIAEQMFISVKTVETHKSNVMRKLELKSTGELRQWIRLKEQISKGIILARSLSYQ